MNKEIVGALFPEAIQAVERGECPICGKKIIGFRDALSLKEFRISGMCQECQDGVFGAGEDDA